LCHPKNILILRALAERVSKDARTSMQRER
jgi:hypothetical protein